MAATGLAAESAIEPILSLAVSDTGTGFEQGNMDRIFDAFFTTKPQGMGLGLSICRSIVEAHGGRLWASANVPRGAIFQFTVPLREHGS
jgi:signal transduction histidine kinase